MWGLMQAARGSFRERDRTSPLSCNSGLTPASWGLGQKVPLQVPARCLNVSLWVSGERGPPRMVQTLKGQRLSPCVARAPRKQGEESMHRLPAFWRGPSSSLGWLGHKWVWVTLYFQKWKQVWIILGSIFLISKPLFFSSSHCKKPKQCNI